MLMKRNAYLAKLSKLAIQTSAIKSEAAELRKQPSLSLLVVPHFLRQAKQREPSQTKSFLQQLVNTDLRTQHFLPSLLSTT